MSPLTLWHYLLVGSLLLLFLLGTLLALRTNSKFSIFTTITLILVLIGVFSWKVINEKVYRVEVYHLEDKRIYQSEKLMIKGVVRNVGDFPVANIVVTVKLTNTNSGTNPKASQFAQPTVFAELYEDDNPDFKRQNIVEHFVVADYLNPGKAKTFRIMMDYPPYFKKPSYDVTAKAN